MGVFDEIKNGVSKFKQSVKGTFSNNEDKQKNSKYCSECGAKISREAKFCEKCGKDLNSTGEKVKNQELIKSTYINILLLMQQINVFICHVNSHQPQSKIPQMYEKLNKDFPDMSYDEFVLIYDGNNHCDETARKALN